MKHHQWTTEDWKKLLWTDESKFKIFCSSRRSFVRRRVERMVPQCVTLTVKHGGGSMMFFWIQGRLPQLSAAIPCSSLWYACSWSRFILQQDNDPKHKSKLSHNYLRKKEQDGKLENMEWPAESPDLNPIELVQDELDRRVKAKQTTSATHLWELLQQSWEELSEEYLISIAERMPQVCSAVTSA